MSKHCLLGERIRRSARSYGSVGLSVLVAHSPLLYALMRLRVQLILGCER